MNGEVNALVIEEVVLAAERRFARDADRRCLTRAAMGAAIDLLATSPRVTDYIPELALGSALRQDRECRLRRVEDWRRFPIQEGPAEASGGRILRFPTRRDAPSDAISSQDF